MKLKTGAFQLVQNDKNIIVLPISVLEELVEIPQLLPALMAA